MSREAQLSSGGGHERCGEGGCNSRGWRGETDAHHNDGAAARESFYRGQDKIWLETESGVHPEDDWGELRFYCLLVTDELDERPPFDIAYLCEMENVSTFIPLLTLIDISEAAGERKVYLTYFTYRKRLVASATFVVQPHHHVAAVFNVVVVQRQTECRLPNLLQLLFAAAARRLDIAFIFFPSMRGDSKNNVARLASLPSDVCAEPFTCFLHEADSIFSPHSPHRHPWLTFGDLQDTPFEDRVVKMRECVVQKSDDGARYSLQKMIFHGDNNPRRLRAVSDASYASGQWSRLRPAYHDLRHDENNDPGCRVVCPAPNYAAACPNMFLSHFMDTNSFSVLHIIDGRLLGQRLPLPHALPRPSRAIALAMALHPRLGAGSSFARLDSDFLRALNRLSMHDDS